MHKSFATLEDLFSYIQEDKEWQGVNSGQHNRYPIRFVLFDNFVLSQGIPTLLLLTHRWHKK